MENEQMENYKRFLDKQVKIILTFGNGKAITYRGVLLNVDSESVLILDKMHGVVVLTKKDISQIIEVQK